MIQERNWKLLAPGSKKQERWWPELRQRVWPDREGHCLTCNWRREEAGRQVIWSWKGDLMVSNQSSSLGSRS